MPNNNQPFWYGFQDSAWFDLLLYNRIVCATPLFPSTFYNFVKTSISLPRYIMLFPPFAIGHGIPLAQGTLLILRDSAQMPEKASLDTPIPLLSFVKNLSKYLIKGIHTLFEKV